MNRISLALLTLCTGVALQATAQSRLLPVLEANPDARSAAMGNTLLGNTGQMHIHTNPAALTFGDTRFAADITTEMQPKTDAGRLMQYNFGAGWRFANRSALLAGMRYQAGLTVPSVGTDGQPASVSPYEMAIDLGYSFAVVPEIAVYATATYARSSAATSANAWAFSVGAAYQKAFRLAADMPTTLTAGARLMDFGKSVKFNDTGIPYSLPTSVVVGGDWSVRLAPEHALTYAVSCRHFTPKDAHETLFANGLEYTYHGMLSARVGYQQADKGSDALTFGAGGRFHGFRLDVTYHHAFASYGINTLMLGVGYAL